MSGNPVRFRFLVQVVELEIASPQTSKHLVAPLEETVTPFQEFLSPTHLLTFELPDRKSVV